LLLIRWLKKKLSFFFSWFSFEIISFAFFELDPTGNNCDATELQEVVPEKYREEGGEDESSGFKVKERSILQAKLTKLAIQIGYAG